MKISKIASAIAVLGLGLAASAAFSSPLSSVIPGGNVLFSDNSAEQLIDRGDGLGGAANGLLDVGDSLRGIFAIGTIEGGAVTNGIGTGTSVNELSGLFQVVVTSKTLLFTNPISGQSFYNYTFGVDSAFGQGANVVGVLYEDPLQNFARQNCGTFAQCEATATNGTVWAKMGLDFWSSTFANDNPDAGAVLPLSTPLATFGLGMNIIENDTGFTWNKVSCLNVVTGATSLTDFCGQGGALASGRNLPGATQTPYAVFDNVDFTANRVPEPASAALLGLGLLGLGFARRRQN
jgi:hypothetical protein